MSTEYKLSYTANEIDEKLGMIDQLSEEIEEIKKNGGGCGSLDVTDDGAGHVTIELSGLSVTDDGAGHVTID